MAPQDYSAIPGIAPQPEMAGDVSAPSEFPAASSGVQPGTVPTNLAPLTTPDSQVQVPGKSVDPEAVLKDPNAPDDLKMLALNHVKGYEAQQAQKTAEAEQAKVLEQDQQFQQYQQKLAQVDQYNSEAKSRGLKPMEMPDPSKFGLDAATITKLSNPVVQEQIQPLKQQAAEQAQVVEQAKQDRTQQIHAEKRLQNKMVGEQSAMQKAQESMQLAMDDLGKQQAQLDNVDPQRFWKNQDTFTKILGAIAVGLGGGDLKNNPAFQIMDKAIERDIAAQKVNQDKALALKTNAYKRAEAEIQRFGAMSKDAERKQAAAALQAQLQQAQQSTMQEATMRRQIAHSITAGEGITQQDAYVIDPEGKLRKNLIPMPNGKLKAATNEDAAKEFQKWQGATGGAMRLAKDLEKQVSELSTMDKLKPGAISPKKKMVNETVQALVGQLRIPLTGPGILTETEYDRIVDKVIGDPTSLTTIKSTSLAQIRHLTNLLNNMQIAQYEAAGVTMDKNDPSYRKQLKLQNFITQQLKADVPPDKVEMAARKLGLMD